MMLLLIHYVICAMPLLVEVSDHVEIPKNHVIPWLETVAHITVHRRPTFRLEVLQKVNFSKKTRL